MKKLGAVMLMIGIGLGIGYSRLAAHPGGLDANGGHYNRKTGEYHVHRPRAPRSPQSQGLMDEGAAPGPRSLAGLTSSQKVDALVAVLVRRGLVTEAELLAELNRGR